MSTIRRFAAIALILSLTAPLFGCGDDDPTGPSFGGPSIAGEWIGTFRDANVTMSLRQSGDQVTGTVTHGRQNYDLTGTIDETGVFRWGATDTLPTVCRSMSSSLGDFTLESRGTEMSGAVRKATRNGPPDDPCSNSRTLVEQGTMELEKL